MAPATQSTSRETVDREVVIGPLHLAGNLRLPAAATALVIFAHGSGSSRFSPRSRMVAEALNGQSMATLLFDLLTPEEEQDRANVFDIALLAERLVEVVRWVDRQPELAPLPLGLFGASTGAAAALVGWENFVFGETIFKLVPIGIAVKFLCHQSDLVLSSLSPIACEPSSIFSVSAPAM